MLITAIIFLIINYIFNLMLPWITSEDSAVWNKSSPEEYQQYLERTRNMAPRFMIKGWFCALACKVKTLSDSGSAYHYETVASANRERVKEEKCYSYEGEEVFHYDKWLDLSDWQKMADIPTTDQFMTIVSFSFESVPGDEYTKLEQDTFISNYKAYVKDLDAYTGKFKERHQIMTGHDTDSFREVFVKQEKLEIDDTEDDDDKKDVEKNQVSELFDVKEPSNTFSIITPGVTPPWYTRKSVLFITSALAISLIPKILISFSARKFSFHVKKIYFSDPENPFTDYMFIKQPTAPYTGPGRGHMPLLSSDRSYERQRVEVEHKPAGDNQTTASKPGAVLSLYQDVAQMSESQNY